MSLAFLQIGEGYNNGAFPHSDSTFGGVLHSKFCKPCMAFHAKWYMRAWEVWAAGLNKQKFKVRQPQQGC